MLFNLHLYANQVVSLFCKMLTFDQSYLSRRCFTCKLPFVKSPPLLASSAEVPGLIPSQGPRHTKDVMQMVPVVPLLSTEHSNGKILVLSLSLIPYYSSIHLHPSPFPLPYTLLLFYPLTPLSSSLPYTLLLLYPLTPLSFSPYPIPYCYSIH